MLKLYRFSNDRKEYWETWDDGKGSHTIHWGDLGSRGQSKTVKSTFFTKAETKIQEEVDGRMKAGFHTIGTDD